ncbi:MAG TPA: T9SS type A sorting domain-containing protein [Bacteroidia bacterium]|nr:T9SS type A sorting domain-containing protein [Bacteroidia bacterium]
MKKSLLFLFGSVLFTAGSLTAQTVYLSEDFEGGSMPAGWNANPTTNAWAVPSVTSTYFAPPAHTVFAGCDDDAVQTAANAASDITSPVVNLSAATTVVLKYDAFFQGLAYNNITEVGDVIYSTDGGTTWTVAGTVPANTTAWGTYTINLSSQLAGQSNVKIGFRYEDGGEWLYGLGVDNVSLSTPAANDAAVMTLNPVAGSPAAYGLVSNQVTFTGTIMNDGLNPITSMALKYNDGTTTYTDNISAVNIASFATYNFSHNVPYTIPSTGAHPITFWVELSGDGDHTNDTLTTSIVGVSFMPVHSVTVEEGTGTWCGWCVRGIVYMDSMRAVHPTTTSLIAVHNGDPMVVTAYDAGVGTLISGYPSTLVNRALVSDPMNIFDDYNNSIGDFGFADLTPTITFNMNTRVATVVANAHFAVDLSGDYRLACVFTEDDVHGTGSTWDQHNYYSSQSQNLPLVDPESGWDFQTLPATIPNAQMYYDFVARTIVGGFTGQTGSLPANIAANSTQTYTFNYTVPAGYDVTKMRAYILLIDNQSSTVRILNSAGGAVPLGVSENASLNGVVVYPNPASDATNVEVDLLNNDNISVEVYDMTGNLVSSSNEGQMSAGKHNIAVNTSSFANGMYFVKVISSNSVVTNKVTVSH